METWRNPTDPVCGVATTDETGRSEFLQVVAKTLFLVTAHFTKDVSHNCVPKTVDAPCSAKKGAEPTDLHKDLNARQTCFCA